MNSAREITFPQAVEEEADFFDRADPVDKICAALNRRDRRTVVILGGRLMGKTSLLNVVTHWAESQAFAVVRLAHAGSRSDFMAEIVHGIQERVGPDGRAGGELAGPDAAPGAATVARFVKVIQDCAARAPDLRFLLCVDEFDSLLQGCKDDDEARQILDLVLYLTVHARLPLRFLFTMSRIPERVRLSYSSPFLNQSAIVELEPWSASQSRDFTEWLLDDRLRLDEDAHRMLFEATGGHPYFVKSVLRALMARPEPDPRPEPGPDFDSDQRPAVNPIAMQTAVQAAVRSREVDVALSNIAAAHLSDPEVAVLDRVAASPGGLMIRDDAELAVAAALDDSGLLTQDGNRYSLRLGLWTQWRRIRPQVTRPRPLAGLGRAVKAVVGGKALMAALLSLLGFLLLALAFVAVFLFPRRSFTYADCPGAAASLRVRVSYPAYVSSGDQENISVQVLNESPAGSAPIDGFATALFNSPPGRVSLGSGNTIAFNRLPPGGQESLTVDFSYAQPGHLFPDTRPGIPVQLRVSAAGSSCPPRPWSLGIAPIPHLRVVRSAAFGLVGVVLIPLMIELSVRRHERRSTARG